MNRLVTRGRLLAVAGIVILVLSFMSSAENPPGVPAMPFVLILLSRTAMLAFVVTATISLWNRARKLALVFAGINWLQVLAFAMALTQGTLTLKKIPMILVHAPMMWPEMGTSHRFPILIAGFVTRVASLILYVWVIVKLFITRAPGPALPADALREEPRSRGRARTGAVLAGLGTVLSIALVMLFGISARQSRLARTNFLAKHPALPIMCGVQRSLDIWAKENGGAYPYAAEFDSDSSRFMKFLARDRVG
jgi:hypothetical protein